jgi:hypothetical protein
MKIYEMPSSIVVKDPIKEIENVQKMIKGWF